jgi:hypothetical protein
MSLPADLRPLQWNLVARRRVSSFSLFDGGVRSGGVTLRDGTTTSMVGVEGGGSLCLMKETTGGW